MARERSWQSCFVHNHHGHCPRHVSTVSSSKTDPEDPSGQVCGKGRLHESGSAKRDQRTSQCQDDFRATIVRRGKSHRGWFTHKYN